jgi:hypothetical protein
LLIQEALAKAFQASYGAGPSTSLHRLLKIAAHWNDQGMILLKASRDALDPRLADLLEDIGGNTVPLLIAETRRVLPPAGDDSHRGDNQFFKEARDAAYNANERLRRYVVSDQDIADLIESLAKWPLLGFANADAYDDFLIPSIETLTRNPDPMQKELFCRLIDQPDFTPRQLVEEGYRSDLVMDTVNALMAAQWAKWTDLTHLGSNATGQLSGVGQRLLEQALDSNNAGP